MYIVKVFLFFIVSLAALSACSPNSTVKISGRVENGDSIVSFFVEDSIYTFSLDKNDFFSGEVKMKRSGYITFLHHPLNLYLSPGEDLEIYVNTLNFLGSLHFRGSLGGINSYLKEQEGAQFFDRDYYLLPENEFVEKMQQLIDEKNKLLEAKNFDDSFTDLEKERIRYSVAEQVALYPVYQRRNSATRNYVPGKVFSEFLSSFSLNNEELFSTENYRSFLLNYLYLQGDSRRDSQNNVSEGLADYVLSSVTNPVIKDFLLTELVIRHIQENNGLNGADYLLSVFWREVKDEKKLAYMKEIVAYWEKLLPNKMAPSFKVEDRDGRAVVLEQFRGSYLYIMVWATWCVPCKLELPHWDLLQKDYWGQNIQFLTIAIDEEEKRQVWKNFFVENLHAGLHTFSHAQNSFNQDYMIISVPRFILIGPDGRIIDANAPRPSGNIRSLLDNLQIEIVASL